jgi:nucleoside-diphosphate-sugar epimerase
VTTVLVTGASGRLGVSVVARLRGSHRVRALVHRREVDADEVAHGDLVTGEGLRAALDGVDAVVHLAGLTHSRRASEYDRVNVEGTRNLVEAARDVERIVLVSTRAIDPAGGAYSASKARAEELVRAAPVGWVVLRLAEVYGAGGREGVDAIVASARSGRPVLLVGDGSTEVCPIHVDDACDAIVGAFRAPTGRTYTIGGDCRPLRAFAEACIDAFGSRSRIVRVPKQLVALAARASSVVPLPLVPDQPARLSAPKERPSPDAEAELGFRVRPLAEGLR